MKRLFAALGGVLLALLVLLIASPRFAEKRAGLATVASTLAGTGYHQIPIAESGSYVLRARCNLATIEKAIEYMRVFDSNTLVFRDIARVAADADRECPQLAEVLDLAARSTQESGRLVDLAEEACSIRNEEDERQWRARYDQLSALAVYPTVSAALRAQKDS